MFVFQDHPTRRGDVMVFYGEPGQRSVARIHRGRQRDFSGSMAYAAKQQRGTRATLELFALQHGADSEVIRKPLCRDRALHDLGQ